MRGEAARASVFCRGGRVIESRFLVRPYTGRERQGDDDKGSGLVCEKVHKEASLVFRRVSVCGLGATTREKRKRRGECESERDIG